MDKWIDASTPPPHNKDVLIQEKESNLMYVGRYNEYTKKYIFVEFPIHVECWMELPKPRKT